MELGRDETDAATLDPVVAYQFTFGVPILNRDASLAFTLQARLSVKY